jgi:hypothetical protein
MRPAVNLLEDYGFPPLVVSDNLDIVGVAILEPEDEAPWAVDRHRLGTGAISAPRVQAEAAQSPEQSQDCHGHGGRRAGGVSSVRCAM